ncbi:uncharacterized protein [Musca autumnalis]|uniref:uncharacterized protein n=1 Tax=Musca autumnalis TaxID=221902 RepID=UPI003CF62487
MVGGAFNENFPCPVCKRPHALRQCTSFLALDDHKKGDIILKTGVCINCLAQTHKRSQCRSQDVCRRCKGFHHSLLHYLPDGFIWFSMTALIRIYTCTGRRAQTTRVLLEPNSKWSFIAVEEARKLHCIIDDNRTTVVLQHSSLDKRRVQVECVVRDRVFGFAPTSRVDEHFNLPDEIPVDVDNADKWWYMSSPYYLILGAEACRDIFTGPTVAQPGKIFTQNSVFGQLYFGEGRVVPIKDRLN